MGTIIQIMRGYVHHTNVCIVGLPVVAIFGKQHKQNGRYLTISQKLRVVELSLPTLYICFLGRRFQKNYYHIILCQYKMKTILTLMATILQNGSHLFRNFQI